MTNAMTPIDDPVLTLAPEDRPGVEHLITEDDTPVDNWFSEKQQALLVRPLYLSWPGPSDGSPFVAAANVGLYYSVNETPLVPDVLLSLNVEMPEDWWEKRYRVYFVWEFGKPPDVAIEVVSNKVGGEADEKKRRYAWAGVPYYVIFDPLKQIQDEVLAAYHLTLPQRTYMPTDPGLLTGIELGLTLWRGEFEGENDLWLRWQDAEGNLISTGQERIAQAEQEADRERRRAERLAAQLRALGVEPENNTE